MEDFSKELKALKIILKDDIIKLRQYIHKKYPHYDNHKRALVLGNAIRSIVDKNLSGFPRQYRSSIRERLLSQSLLTGQEGIFLYDVLQTTLSMDIEEDSFFDEVSTWVNSHVTTPIDSHTIKEYHFKKLQAHTYEINPLFDSNTSILISNTDAIYCKEIAPSPVADDSTAIDPSSKHTLRYVLALFFSLIIIGQLTIPMPKADEPSPLIIIEEPITYVYSHLPAHFYYKEIDTTKLKLYLNTRDSLLAEEPYFSAIIEVSKEFQLNALILFAIAGHEQGFVPKNHPSAEKIANNPFNVFNSWQSYNTDIYDTSAIAARTIINLSKDRPEEIEPFKWINRRYAEDENWWIGVTSIYNRLEQEVE
ncbi:glucosaminidase domain-containing protein [Alkaliphilus peptidifermentans]|uniref:Mannosyl-glycoprotein endo-beta-N-acetylglucosaminidase n=1 Tax=Alkaliphilus peptidifermentans DSM 18978 TaxID=1120976 RepID=A0A1G5FUQ6_9FIRM|nr:glucosaminidase domain-containing protein [Alkaliphilus peptidifermentans]SCY43102.1 Mannosyl-glycoprotein endo-beta-N-acetylglucosaminidase [Alkaliphilus peptidifermentans DSM 18978]